MPLDYGAQIVTSTTLTGLGGLGLIVPMGLGLIVGMGTIKLLDEYTAKRPILT